jgi:hypothetical protein
LNYDLLELQRHINRLPLSVQQKRRFHHELMALSQRSRGAGFFDEGPVIDDDRAEQILASYAESNRRVAQRYFARDRLFLEDRKRSVADSARRDGLTVEKLLHVLGSILVQEA